MGNIRVLVEGTEEDEFALYRYYGVENTKELIKEKTLWDTFYFEQ